jgi:hypothetical protein
MYNQVGGFGEGGETLCKSLFMGGVTRRFPDLHFAFLEGGMAWACETYAGLIGRWRKRNGNSVRELDPKTVDEARLRQLVQQYGNGAAREKIRGALDFFSMGHTPPPPGELDDFSALEVDTPEALADLFTQNFYFGCEADEPMNVWAFRSDVNPLGARLKAIFGSDIAHWDVPNMNAVLEEAYELVESGLLTEEDFRDFVFTNPVMLHAGMNPDFFVGTRVEGEVNELLQGRGRTESADG